MDSDSPRDARLPTTDWSSFPDTYRIVVAEREALKLRVQVDGKLAFQWETGLKSPAITLIFAFSTTKPLVSRLRSEDPPIALVHIQIEGLQANAEDSSPPNAAAGRRLRQSR